MTCKVHLSQAHQAVLCNLPRQDTQRNSHEALPCHVSGVKKCIDHGISIDDEEDQSKNTRNDVVVMVCRLVMKQKVLCINPDCKSPDHNAKASNDGASMNPFHDHEADLKPQPGKEPSKALNDTENNALHTAHSHKPCKISLARLQSICRGPEAQQWNPNRTSCIEE